MKNLIYIIPSTILLLAGCNNATRVFDSEISAINRQSEVLREQNRILKRIAIALERTEKTKGEAE